MSEENLEVTPEVTVDVKESPAEEPSVVVESKYTAAEIECLDYAKAFSGMSDDDILKNFSDVLNRQRQGSQPAPVEKPVVRRRSSAQISESRINELVDARINQIQKRNESTHYISGTLMKGLSKAEQAQYHALSYSKDDASVNVFGNLDNQLISQMNSRHILGDKVVQRRMVEDTRQILNIYESGKNVKLPTGNQPSYMSHNKEKIYESMEDPMERRKMMVDIATRR